jgi:hypothetical protein
MAASRSRRGLWIGLGALAAAAALVPVLGPTLYARLRPRRTVDQVLAELGAAAEARLRPSFDAAGLALPPAPSSPAELALIGFKAERRLELWARDAGRWTHVRDWPVLGASGTTGPKLREGDRQVPEGLYRIASLNPSSRFHLSLEIDYPNAFDRAHAAAEGRDPGGEIFVHGSDRSIGCLAIGDEAIEELFVLAARVGPDAIEVVLAPNDPAASGGLARPADPPAWLPELHAAILARLRRIRGA